MLFCVDFESSLLGILFFSGPKNFFLSPDGRVATDKGRLAQSNYLHRDTKERFLGFGMRGKGVSEGEGRLAFHTIFSPWFFFGQLTACTGKSLKTQNFEYHCINCSLPSRSIFRCTLCYCQSYAVVTGCMG